MYNPVPIFEISCKHGEGPVWDAASNTLYWVDLLEGRYYKGQYHTTGVSFFEVGQPLGFLGRTTNKDEVVVGVRDGFGYFNESSKSLELVVNAPEQSNERVRFNDGAIDPKGRVFGGTMEWSGAKGEGKLFRLDSESSWQEIDKNYDIANGMGWSPEKDTFFVVDSLQHCIYAFDYELETGTISNKRIHIKFNEEEIPDGMTIDTEGGFWVAMWGASKVLHFTKDGKLLDEVLLPVMHPTSCCFGGEDMKTLFITTSKLELNESQRKEYPLAGRTFFVETNVVGQIESKHERRK